MSNNQQPEDFSFLREIPDIVKAAVDNSGHIEGIFHMALIIGDVQTLYYICKEKVAEMPAEMREECVFMAQQTDLLIDGKIDAATLHERVEQRAFERATGKAHTPGISGLLEGTVVPGAAAGETSTETVPAGTTLH